MLRLFHAARRNRLEFLLEVIPSKAGPVDEDTTAPVIQRFYDLGVYPDWWKLEPHASPTPPGRTPAPRSPRNDAHTPGYRRARPRLGRGDAEGVLRRGGAPPARQGLRRRPHDLRRGRRGGFMAGEVDAGAAVETMRRNYARLCALWDDGPRAPQKGTPHDHDPTDRRAGDGALPVGPDDRGGRSPSSPAAGRSSATATSQVWARRSTPARDALPTYRGHNEQTMAHAAIAYAKQLGRRRAMMVTSSIGPGATNMVTAAALAHVNRLPVLFVPGDVFATRGPDPVLQQVEDFGDGTVSANDCFRPVSPLLRPHHAARTASDRAAARHAGDDRPGRVRAGDARLLPGRAGRGLRLARGVLPPGDLADAPAAARPRGTRRRGADHRGGESAGDRRRRRRPLFPRDRSAEGLRRGAPASRWSRRRPASRRCPGTIR